MKKKLLFIINPKAGRTAIKNELFEIIMVFSNAGYEVVTYPTTGPEDAERKICADGAEYDLIVCAGGDGTLENTVCGYMKMGEKKVPIGYIPVGTTNDFARSLKISRKPIEAAREIVSGKETFIDVGMMEDKYFIYIAAFGIFTDISYSTNQSLKKVMGHSAYIVEALKNITSYHGFKLEADFDGKHVSGEYIYGMVTNSFSVAGFKIRGAKHVVLDDGKFDCLFIKMPQNAVELQQILTALLSNDIDGNEMFFECKASQVRIQSETPISWTLDGEFGGEWTEVNIQNRQKAIGMFLGQTSELEGIQAEHDEIAVTEQDKAHEKPEEQEENALVYDADVEDDYFDSWD